MTEIIKLFDLTFRNFIKNKNKTITNKIEIQQRETKYVLMG